MLSPFNGPYLCRADARLPNLVGDASSGTAGKVCNMARRPRDSKRGSDGLAPKTIMKVSRNRTMAVPDPTCQQFVEYVTDYLEQALPPDMQLACDEHLAGCTKCGTYLDQMKQTILALGRLIDESVEPETREELILRFRSWKSGG